MVASDEFPDDFELDGSEFSGDDLGGGGTVDKEGWYHFEVAEVTPELNTLSDGGKEKSPAIRFNMSVLAGPQGGSPVRSMHFHRIYLAGKGGAPAAEGAKKSALRFGLGLGLIREVEHQGKRYLVDTETNQPKITRATWDRAKGRQCVAKVVCEHDEKYGDRFQIPFGRVYHPDAPEVTSCPKDEESVKLYRAMTGAPTPGVKPSTPPQQTKTEHPTPPTEGNVGDDLADL